MEWLAGGRVPSWASPYSAQATAALKAQFPTQWPTILDYGFAHPALVPFINEDPMLVMSLIEGLGERWITCDKKAFIQTPFLASKNLGYRIRSKSNSLGTNTIIYGGIANVRLGLSYYTSLYSYVTHYNNTYHVKSNFPDQMVWHTFEQNIEIGKFKVDGTTYETWTWNTNAEGGNMHVPTEYIGERPDSDISFFEFWDNQTQTMLGRFVPCKHKVNGELEAGWLDIVSAVWYGNIYSEGQFTISESPA